MRCPFCQVDQDKVIDTRVVEGGRQIRRRRECLHCQARFTTFEKIESRLSVTVVKRDDSRVPYSRDKLSGGIRKACYKRKVSEERIERMVETIEEELMRQGHKEVRAKTIGLLVCEQLKRVDHVAFMRFASVYLNPDKVDDLLEELVQARREQAEAPPPGQQPLF